ncbi:hypothetical protein BDK51DRAFT_51486 [Blyttiomyces helicus]|uniref:Uncharacterized protein n=1 Tax=Blyttiomyces helicus TaxID=388810 RepID=A0A4P9WH47_9FUNG|nr:hypothetical protein BDK51DRAFT_51486 [Blyttiomyces helicus]|eukprot:RKO92139.1 hypothetical protein BDK51DRAFT_51486 [Blyttiomyces helicus]
MPALFARPTLFTLTHYVPRRAPPDRAALSWGCRRALHLKAPEYLISSANERLQALLRAVETLHDRTEKAERRADHADRELALVRKALSQEQSRALQPAPNAYLQVEVERLRAAVRSMGVSLRAVTACRPRLADRSVRHALLGKSKRGSPSAGVQVEHWRRSMIRPWRRKPLPEAVAITGLQSPMVGDVFTTPGSERPTATLSQTPRPIVDDVIAKTRPPRSPPSRTVEKVFTIMTRPESPPPRPMVPHRTFNPDTIALAIIDGAKQLGLKPLFSQPYSAFVLSDAKTAEKFMGMVVTKSRAMGHPDTRAIRMIGISFETENRSGRAPLTMALAEGLVAIFDISRICTAGRRLPSSVEYMLGKGGAVKVGFEIKENCRRFQSIFKIDNLHPRPRLPPKLKMHSVFNIDDFARANFLPDDGVRSLASHVGVQSAAEDGHPDPDGHRRNADAALASLRLLRVLLHRPGVRKLARPSAYASDSATASNSNLGPALIASAVRHRASMRQEQLAGSLVETRVSRSSSDPTPASHTIPAPDPTTTVDPRPSEYASDYAPPPNSNLAPAHTASAVPHSASMRPEQLAGFLLEMGVSRGSSGPTPDSHHTLAHDVALPSESDSTPSSVPNLATAASIVPVPTRKQALAPAHAASAVKVPHRKPLTDRQFEGFLMEMAFAPTSPEAFAVLKKAYKLDERTLKRMFVVVTKSEKPSKVLGARMKKLWTGLPGVTDPKVLLVKMMNASPVPLSAAALHILETTLPCTAEQVGEIKNQLGIFHDFPTFRTLVKTIEAVLPAADPSWVRKVVVMMAAGRVPASVVPPASARTPAPRSAESHSVSADVPAFISSDPTTAYDLGPPSNSDSTPSSHSTVTLAAPTDPAVEEIPTEKTIRDSVQHLKTKHITPTSPKAMAVLHELYGLSPEVIIHIQREVSKVKPTNAHKKLRNLILEARGKTHTIPLPYVIHGMMEASPAPLSEAALDVLKRKLALSSEYVGQIVLSLRKDEDRPTFGALMKKLHLVRPNYEIPRLWKIGSLMVVAETNAM